MPVLILTFLLLWAFYRIIRAAFRWNALAGIATFLAVSILLFLGMHELAATVHAM